jgi:hypothetical protein
MAETPPGCSYNGNLAGRAISCVSLRPFLLLATPGIYAAHLELLLGRETTAKDWLAADRQLDEYRLYHKR